MAKTQRKPAAKKQSGSILGTVIADPAFVYKSSDFDSPVIAHLKKGAVHRMSKTPRGPFYKVRVKSGMVGWVADTDIRPGAINLEKKRQQEKRKALQRQPYLFKKFRGPVLEYVQFTEDTQEYRRRENLLFLGAKFTGYNTLFEGEMYIDSSILFHFDAPKYYEEATGKSASGWVMLGQFLFQTALPQSRWHLLFYGFGPTLKYSHFDLQKVQSGKVVNYSADDMILGVVFNVGLSFQTTDTTSLRTEFKYYWERTQYPSMAVAYQFYF